MTETIDNIAILIGYAVLITIFFFYVPWGLAVATSDFITFVYRKIKNRND